MLEQVTWIEARVARATPSDRRPDAARWLASVALLGLACNGGTGLDSSSCANRSLNPIVAIRLGVRIPGRASLDLGEVCVLRGSDAGSLDLASAGEAREYRLVVQSASEVPGAVTSVRLTLLGPDAAAAQATVVPSVSRSQAPTADQLSAEAASRLELRFRKGARRELRRVGARVYRPETMRDTRTGPADPRVARARSVPPTVGEVVTFRNSVSPDLAVECGRDEPIAAVVRTVGQRFALAEELGVSGVVSDAAYDALLQELDDVVFPVDSAYFGPPADLDGNERVWVLFTRIVNRVTPRGSSTFVAGFFNPSDLADRADCAASNQGEVLYLLAADPGGAFADPVSPAFAMSNARGTTAHELQHLLAAEGRVVFGGGTLFADLEDSWLSEGLAHTAETIAGLQLQGLSTRANLSFLAFGGFTALGGASTFNAYHLANFRRLGEYLADPTGTLALGNPAGNDPGGVSSLRMRGFGWLFLRWLADHFGPESPAGILPGSGEEALFRELTKGGPELLTGTANVERAVQVLAGPTQWGDLFGEYAVSPIADDDVPGQVPQRLQIPSFDLRDIFSGLHQSRPNVSPFGVEYPLLTTTETLAPTTDRVFDFDLGASTARYFILRSDGPHPAVSIQLTTPTGAEVPLSARPQLTVVRTR